MAATIAFYESIGFDVHAYDDGFAFVQYEDVSQGFVVRARFPLKSAS